MGTHAPFLWAAIPSEEENAIRRISGTMTIRDTASLQQALAPRVQQLPVRNRVVRAESVDLGLPQESFTPGIEQRKEAPSPSFVSTTPASPESPTSISEPQTNNAPRILMMEPETAPEIAGAQELGSWSDALKTVDSYEAAVLIVGFGSKGQYKDPEATQLKLDRVADNLDAEFGKGRWLAVFGGDPYKPESPDVAAMVKHLQDQRSVPLLAFQSDKVKEWGGVDAHLDYVHYVPTTTVPSTEADGSVTSKIVWGGFMDGKPAGPTAAYLSEDFVGGKNPRLKRMVAIGGGDIAAQEAQYAQEKAIPVHYIRAQARFEVPGGKYGSVDGVLG